MTNLVAMTATAPRRATASRHRRARPGRIAVPPAVRRPRATHTSTTTHALRDPRFRRFWPRPAILRHDPGLAASPPVRYRLKVEGSGYSPSSLIVRCGTDHLAKRRRAAYAGTVGPGGSPMGLRLQPRNEKLGPDKGTAHLRIPVRNLPIPLGPQAAGERLLTSYGPRLHAYPGRCGWAGPGQLFPAASTSVGSSTFADSEAVMSGSSPLRPAASR